MNSAGLTAFAFPGAGVKPCGREASFYRRHRDTLRPLLRKASLPARADLVNMFEEGSIDSLDDETHQYFTFAFSAGLCDVLKQERMAPDVTAGYSFGIYAALYAGAAISFSDGLKMIETAYSLMKRATAGREAGLCVVIGLTAEDIQDIIARSGLGSPSLVISNSDTCKVISGIKGDLEQMRKEADRRGAVMTELLGVDVAYHHPSLLKDVSREFKEFLNTLGWKEPQKPVISSIDRSMMTRAQELIDFTADNLSTPMDWQKVVEALHAEGVRRIIECGPGISLTQNGRFMPCKIEYVNVKNIEKRLGI